jgi:hypothetical protein
VDLFKAIFDADSDDDEEEEVIHHTTRRMQA